MSESPLKILLYHPVRLPPRDYGGVERVVLWLATALRDLGHEVGVAALEGSRLPPGVRLVPVRTGSIPDHIPGIERWDFLHSHSPLAKAPAIPHLVTIHGNAKPGERFLSNTSFLSRDHALRHGRQTFVYNGVDPAEFYSPVRKPRSSRPLFLSKTSWKVKNLAGAIKIAKRAEQGLTIAGGYRPVSLLLKSWMQGFEWVGPVSGDFKAQVLAEASCLLFPVQWSEPFGLVMVEAMLSGTPVVGAAVGSVPEVVDRSGGVVLPWDDEGAWIDAINTVRGFDPQAVRDAAISRFSHWKMAEGYLEIYRRISNLEEIA